MLRPVRETDHADAMAPAVVDTAGYQPPVEPDRATLLGYWRMLWRHKNWLLVAGCVGGILGFLITLPQTPVYQAHTSVEIVALNSNFLNINQNQVNPTTQTGTVGDTIDLATQTKILTSHTLLSRVTAKLSPRHATGAPAGGPLAAWRRALHLGPDASAGRIDAAIAMAVDSVKVKASSGSRILDITVDSTEPVLAADFANRLTSEYIEQSLEARWKATEHTGQWLSGQLEEMRIKLERSEDELQTYAHRSGLMFTDEKTPVSEEKLKQLQQSLSAAQSERIAKQSHYEMAAHSAPETLPDILNDDGLRDYQNKITELRRQIAESAGTLTANHPKIKQLQAQIAVVQAALEAERGAILKRIWNEYEEARRKETLLAATYSDQAARVTGESEKEIRYNLLKREVDSNRQLYDAMLQQLKQSTIAAAFRASNIQVVDAAKPPLRPYRPNAWQSSGLGLALGIFAGAAFIVARERADRTLQDPGETAYYLQVPELGIIPSSASDPTTPVGLDPHSAEKPELVSRVELVTWQHRLSMLSEAFRSSLISILFSNRNGKRPTVLLLTSPGPNEGKSTVAINLALAISELGQKVLLIDADMRKPRLHQVFGLANENGLNELLAARVPLSDEFTSDAIRPTEVSGLFVITSGKKSASPTSLLSHAYLGDLLSYLRQRFDTIIIDTPPMLQIPDARVIGRRADKVILVIRSEKTTREAAVAARQRFLEDGTEVLGTILNDWNPKHSTSGYYGYSQGYYTTYAHYHSAENGKTF